VWAADVYQDPFDRMVVAQAMTEDLTVVTGDQAIHRYNVKWVW
jgi:PIN domain nuclease of toxin-antitoxin system